VPREGIPVLGVLATNRVVALQVTHRCQVGMIGGLFLRGHQGIIECAPLLLPQLLEVVGVLLETLIMLR